MLIILVGFFGFCLFVCFLFFCFLFFLAARPSFCLYLLKGGKNFLLYNTHFPVEEHFLETENRITESRDIPNWKGPSGIINSNSYLVQETPQLTQNTTMKENYITETKETRNGLMSFHIAIICHSSNK